jgi:putative aldouronate transport system permease protein
MSTIMHTQPVLEPLTIPRKRKRLTKKALSLWVLFLPPVVLLFLFNYMPIWGIIIAFKKYAPYVGILKSPWIGLANFREFLLDPKFWSVVGNTIIISVLDIIFGFPAPIIFALLANEIVSTPFKRTMQTISYLPHFISWVVVFGIFYQFLSPGFGILGRAMQLVGLKPINVFAIVQLFRPMMVTLGIWQGVGWGAILYFATIAGLDPELYDAAYIDGAGRFRQVLHVTLPGMTPMIVLMLIFRLSSIMSVGFDRIFFFSNPLNYEVSDVIAVWVYRRGLVEAQYSLTAAVGLAESFLGFIMLFTANKVSSKVAGLGLW